MQGYAIVFDADGTLIDSSGDLVIAANLTRQELGLDPLAAQDILCHVGRGVAHLVAGVLTEVDTSDIDSLVGRFRVHYRAHLLDTTRPCPHVMEALDALAPWPKAVVTNKPHDLTVDILQGLAMAPHFLCVIGGNSLPHQKPHPLPLTTALKCLGASPQHALMVGDSAIDLATGQAAGVRTVGVPGPIAPAEELAKADHLLASMAELPALVSSLWGQA